MSSAKYHSEKRIDKWKTLYFWLQFLDKRKLVCTICSSQKDRVFSVPNFSSNFIFGSRNFQASALADHDESRCHNQVVREKEHEEAGWSLPPRKAVQHAPSKLSVAEGIQLMGDLYSTYGWLDTVKKLHEIAYYTALKGQSFSNSKKQLEIEQMHRVKYSRVTKTTKLVQILFLILLNIFWRKKWN